MAKIKKSTNPARSCRHCRFYIRPGLSFTLDAAIGSICFVDRDPSMLPGYHKQYQVIELCILKTHAQDSKFTLRPLKFRLRSDEEGSNDHS